MYAATAKPIFIVGCPRSGTTLLASRLDLHSRIAVTPESHFFDITSRKFIKLLNYPLTASKIKRFFASRRMSDFNVDFDEFMECFLKTEQKQFNVFDICMDLYCQKRNKDYWCEKTPQNLKYLKKILDFYPDAKIICIVRDGRDVALSLSKVRWRERNIFIPSLEWNEYASLLMKAKATYTENRLFIVKFEELIERPYKTLNSLCDFIGLDFETNLLSVPQNIPSLIPHWELDWKGNVMNPFNANAVGRWHHLHNNLKKKLLNSIMEANLKLLGYETLDIELSFLEKTTMFFYIHTARFLKSIFDFIERYSRFRSRFYHPF